MVQGGRAGLPKDGATTNCTYDAVGQPTRRLAGDGTATIYTWNARQHLTTITIGTQNSTFADGPADTRSIRSAPTLMTERGLDCRD